MRVSISAWVLHHMQKRLHPMDMLASLLTIVIGVLLVSFKSLPSLHKRLKIFDLNELDGTPRDYYHPPSQHEDFRTVIRFCKSQPEFDPDRIILWGFSSGG